MITASPRPILLPGSDHGLRGWAAIFDYAAKFAQAAKILSRLSRTRNLKSTYASAEIPALSKQSDSSQLLLSFGGSAALDTELGHGSKRPVFG